MTHKMRKTLIMIVMAALIICLMAASLTYTFTYGLYTGGKFDSDNSPYDDLIEFVGAREYTVRSPEELIQAIEDGYSNIVISEDAEQPFVITEGVTDVTANLVLNLNGNVVVRNSRNPMLDVQTNVSVVLVYDSKNTGAFYNPVGSSLMASGGSLTVGSGGYESGPRAEEYENGTAAGELTSQPSDVAIFTRGGITSPDKVDRANQLFYQEIEASSGLVPKTTGRYYQETAGSGYDFVPADTFLVYTEAQNCFIGDGTSSGGVTFEEGKLYVDAEKETVGNDTIITASEFTTPLCDVASCDFYYYYPVNDTAGTSESFQTYAIVYGYWDVMKLAGNDGGTAEDLREKGLVYPYGAVRMVEGEGIVRGGTFYNHFDVANTYGIYAEGGRLSVSRNTAFETTFSSGGEGVCIRSSGESAELTISGGDFSSEIGNTIEMLNGNMTVTKGSFTKDATGADPDSTDNGSAIDIQGGKLSMTGSDAKTFTITGSHVNGIKSSGGGTVTAEHTTFSMSGGTDVVPENGNKYGTDMFGINIDSGTVTANGCDITIYGTYSAGILSMGKNVDGSTVSVGAADNTASEIKVYVPESTKLLSSAGISSEGGKIQLTGNVNIETNGLGITARGPIDITGGEATVTTTHGTGIYVSGATITNTAKLTVKSNITSGWSWVKRPENPNEDVNTNVNNGIYVENGSIDASAGTLNVTHTGVQNDAFGDGDNSGLTVETAYYLFKTKSYAVRVEGSGDTTVTIASGNITNSVGGGVLVNGGTVTLGREGEGAYTADENGNSSGLTVETTGYGLENTDRVLVNNDSFKSWIYRCTTTGGDAVKIDGGTLKILGGQYQTAHGNGIFVRGAQAAEEDAYAVEISGGAFRGYNSSEYGENADLTGPAQSYGIKIIGGKVLVNGGTFGSSNVTRTNGSAFFMGLPDEEAEIKIQRGNFYSKNTDAVATFRYTDITFEDLSDNNQNINISVTADRDRAAVALQDDQLFSQGDRSSTVTINGGTYTANGFGVWYGCSQDNLDIQDGIFTGSNISGLYFQVNPGNNVQLSGGTYYGPKNDVYARGYVVYFDYENRTTTNAIQGNNMNLLYQNLLLDSSQYYAYGDVEAARSKFDLGSDVSYSISREYGEMQYTNDKGLARLRYGISYDQEMVYSKITINHR